MKEILKDSLKNYIRITKEQYFNYMKLFQDKEIRIGRTICKYGKKVNGIYNCFCLEFYENNTAIYFEKKASSLNKFSNISYWLLIE